MDSFVGVIWHAVKSLCGCVKREADFVFDLEENLQSLKGEGTKLDETKKDVQLQIEAQNNPDAKVFARVTGWLQRVERIQQEIKDIEDRGDREMQNKGASKWCPKNCMSSNKLGKDVSKKLKNVQKLLAEAKYFDKEFILVHNVTLHAIEMPLDETVGLDLMFDKVWKSVEEQNIGVIGLYGMGGVGKTTLLKKINNELVKKRLGFDFVMWVVVSNEPNLDTTMDNIRKLIGINDDIWSRNSNQDEKAAKIYGVLKKKKFILLLDDIWDKLDLKLIGVPHPRKTNFQSKVLFTTRLEDVCTKMQAERTFKVEILTEKEALELFSMKVGEETLKSDPRIPQLAEKMAKECQQLPLALIVVGSSMAGVKNAKAWEHSIKNLTSSYSQPGPDLEKKVFSILKFSYDKLDEVQKRCFLYCALYPEDCEIPVADLIDKWTWEKLLCRDMTKSVQDMRDYGESVIEKLKLSCLLETVNDDPYMDPIVKLHDVIHDMAMWLLERDEDNMDLVQRISILDDKKSQKILYPQNMTTLVFLEKYSHVHITRQLEDIKYMKRLKVLQLTVNGGVSADIGSLISLEYLSLLTREVILGREFWINLKSLTNLKFLNCGRLSFSIAKWDIPSRVISSLQQLRVFRLTGSRYSEERRILEELESLPNIEELWLQMWTEDGLNKLVESPKLQSCICRLIFVHPGYMGEMPSLSLGSMSGMKQLQEIHLGGMNIISEHYSSAFGTRRLTKLRSVTLESCLVSHVTWLKYAPLLQQLYISECLSMEEVIKEEEEEDNNIVDSSSLFSSLVKLSMSDLTSLKSICKRPLPFSSLKYIAAYNCPELKKLPLNSNSAEKLTIIRGPRKWWESLEWDDSMVKDIFFPKFEAFQPEKPNYSICDILN